MSGSREELRSALEGFAAEVQAKTQALARGEPEEQLRAPFERLVEKFGAALGRGVVAKGESILPEKQGKPDYAVLADGALVGYVELKAPGAGAVTSRFKGRDRDQWKRFSSLPNLIYSDGNSFALYREGTRVGKVVDVSEDITAPGGAAVTDAAALGLRDQLQEFLAWEPIVPKTPKQLAQALAPLCRLLRDNAADAAGEEGSALAHLRSDWQRLLFPDADEAQFADAYAQTLTYALLLAQAEGAEDLAHDAVERLEAEHSLLARTLAVLTDPAVRESLGSILDLLVRTISAVPPERLKGGSSDPWLYFYEDFLAAYDPKLRRDAGVYYTPIEVVRAQVRLADELLRTRMGQALGIAEKAVNVLDPAVGTGTYLLAAIEHATSQVAAAQGAGAVEGKASVLAENLHGFEIMVGPYAVAQLRLTRELRALNASLPPGGAKVFLTDTLEHPSATMPQAPLFQQPIAEQHRRAQQVKDTVPILVCLGNPPYDRHDAAAQLGGWIRFGAQGDDPPLEDFFKPARQAGAGGHLKNLYNLYVYFWRWALWKVFEHPDSAGAGIVTFITASSYLAGPGFVGMREKLRRECDEVWIIDLGGEGRGTRQDDNVFAIKTPVAIAVAARYGPRADDPASVHYTRLRGSRREKLAGLGAIEGFGDLTFEPCPSGWQDPFRPVGVGDYFNWPPLTELFPWQHSGVQVKRSWPIGPDEGTLKGRWQALLASEDRAKALKETDRKIGGSYQPNGNWIGSGPPIADLQSSTPMPEAVPYSYRSLDRQLLLADLRLIDRPRPALWQTRGPRQLFLTSLLRHPLGGGPAAIACCVLPDLHHFRGSFGGKDVMPLWRDAGASEPNVRPGLLDLLSQTYRERVRAEDLFAYVYALLAHRGYTERFEAELETPGPRVPLTQDGGLFRKAASLGRRLLWLHTYGQRCASEADGRTEGAVPQGQARSQVAVSQQADDYPESFSYHEDGERLRVGDGMFSPVSPAVWDYEVSGLRVVASWLGYRMRKRAGRSDSPLDTIQPKRWLPEFTQQLLELIWVLEESVALESKQADLLERIVEGPSLALADLPSLTAEHPARHEPSAATQQQLG